MRWSIVRLIATREIRDQLRDRRTLFLILVLPVLMYPLFIGVGILFLTALKDNTFKVGVVGAEHLPKGDPADPKQNPSLLGPDGQFAARYAASDAGDGVPLEVKPLPSADDETL